MKKIALFLIDPQNCFCTEKEGENRGSLYVPGAEQDMIRCAGVIKNNDFENIFITGDWHKKISIDNINWFVSKDEIKTPTPLKMDVYNNNFYIGRKEQKINTFTEEVHLRTIEYYKYVMNKGITPMIWPEHGIQNTWGAENVKVISEAIKDFPVGKVQRIFKGMCPLTEQHSAFKAVMEVEGYPETKLNTKLINDLQKFDYIFVAGEAFNFCVRDSIVDLVENSPYPFNMSEKIIIMRNLMSNVPGFENDTKKFEDFLNSMNIKQIDIVDYEIPDEFK